MHNRNNRGQFSIIAALFVAVILVSSIMFTYSSVRYNTNQSEPQILSAIDETNLALKQVLGFSVGYYGSVLQVTGDTAYAKSLASHYLDTGLENIADIRPEWGTSIQVNDLSMSTSWFMNSSYSQGTLNVTYDLAGLGLSGIAYSASSRLDVDIFPSPSPSQVCLNVTKDGRQPFSDLSMSNFKFYLYQYNNLTWQMINPPNEPVAFPNGTYLVDIPSGINPYSYVIQVSDTRGINVAASSFNHYTGTMTFNSTVVAGGDYVDDDMSNVDLLASKGSHADFAQQKQAPDSIYDSLAKGNIDTENHDYNVIGSSSTTRVSGSVSDLQSINGAFMAFGSYGSGTSTSAQTLFAHKETITVGAAQYYRDLARSADGSGLTLSTPMSASRVLLGKSVYGLQGISSIPASTWTLNYRAWKDVAPAGIAFDSSSSGNNGGGSSTISWSHTTNPSGSHRIMVVGVSTRSSSTQVSSITIGTQSLTYLRRDTNSNGVRSELWYLVAPNTGTNTITVTLSASSKAVGGACTYTGVDQVNPIDNSTGTSGASSTPSRTITVNRANCLLVGNLAIRGGSPATVQSEGSGQTMRWDSATGSFSAVRGHGSQKGPVSTGSQTMSWTLSGSAEWAVSVVSLKAVIQSAGHVDADVLIRKSDGSIRTNIATNVASSGNLQTTQTTLSGTYIWPGYTVVDQTDFLEIDYFADVSTTSSLNAYLRIDDTSLGADQTKISNVILPNQYSCEVEFQGQPSNANYWNNLLWTIVCNATSNADITFQLWNYTSPSQYSVGGAGYISNTTSSGSMATNEQNIIANSATNPTNFRDTNYAWKIKVIATASSQFDLKIDMVRYRTGVAIYELDLEEQWTNIDLSYLNPHPTLCIKTGSLGSENLAVDVWHSGWHTISGALTTGWNNVSVPSQYLDSSSLTIRFRADNNPISNSWQIDAALLRPGSDEELFTSLQDPSATVAVELLQNGTMLWLGEGLALTSQTIPIPPVPVKDIHVNQNVNGVVAEVPFQVEDWASGYTVPLGLSSNATVFGNRQMIVFLVNTRVTEFTIWWNGSDEAVQTPLAFTNTNFVADNPSGGVLSNGKLRLNFGNGFTVTSTVVATGTSSTSNFMRINDEESTYGAGLAYVIHHGVVRDVVQQEAEWSDGATDCPNLYANIVLTLPANATYFTYQLGLMFINSQQTRTITDLSPIQMSCTVGNLQTENGIVLGDPVVAAGTQTLDSTGIWGHHWSQFTTGTKGAGIMFTNSSNKLLYAFDAMAPTAVRGALKADETSQTIQMLPVTLSPVTFQSALDIAWTGAVATFDGTLPIYNGLGQPGLWVLAELPPTINVKTGN